MKMRDCFALLNVGKMRVMLGLFFFYLEVSLNVVLFLKTMQVLFVPPPPRHSLVNVYPMPAALVNCFQSDEWLFLVLVILRACHLSAAYLLQMWQVLHLLPRED